jgi:hypothetical protein
LHSETPYYHWSGAMRITTSFSYQQPPHVIEIL